MRNLDIKKATYANLARKQLKSISKVSTKQTFKTVSLKKSQMHLTQVLCTEYLAMPRKQA
jgi:hypothetical protein